jgi:hypothetical protein
MSNSNSNSWPAVVTVIVLGIWGFKTCSSSREDRDLEMIGRGMLEAQGIRGELPPGAGKDYYWMKNEGSGEYSSEDYRNFFQRIKEYQNSSPDERNSDYR